MNLKQAQPVFDELYTQVDGYGISLAARKKHSLEDKTYIYGEVTLKAMDQILKDALLTKRHKFFLDVGSGTGKVIVSAALLWNFDQLVGVEIVPELAHAAQGVLSRLAVQMLAANQPLPSTEFICADILSTDFSDVDVVFMHCTCFPQELMDKLIHGPLNKLKRGSYVITAGSSLPFPYQTYGQGKYKMGWGNSLIYFNVKVR